MAITATSLTSGADATDQSSLNTASVSPTANRLILLAVEMGFASSQATPPTPTITYNGTGLTFVLIPGSGVEHWDAGGGSEWNALYLYRAMGSSITSGTITINPGITMDSVAWSVAEFDGVDTSGTNGSGAVVQVAENTSNGTPSTLTVTLSAFSSANNATYAVFGCGDQDGIPRTYTPGAGYSEIHDTGTQYSAIGTQWRSDNDTTADTTLNSALTGGGLAGIAIEIKAAAAGGATNPGWTSSKGGWF